MKRFYLLSVLMGTVAVISSAQAMELISTTAIAGRAVEVQLQGDVAFCADRYGIWVLDINDPQSANTMSHWGSPGFTTAVTVDGTVGYLCNGTDGLGVLDLANPAQPVYVESVVNLSDAESMALDNSLLYVAAGEDGLAVLDLSDPLNPVKIGEYSSGGWARAVTSYSNLVALAVESEGVVILDVTNPSSPTYESEIALAGSAQQVILANDLLYILDRENGVSAWDVSNPGLPDSLGAISTGGWSTDMVSVGEMLLVGDWFDGLMVYDFYNPINPELLTAVQSGGFIEAMDVQGDLLALALGDEGLEFWDISTILSPSYIGSESPEGSPQDVLLTNDGVIFEAAGDAGLRVWDDDLPSGEPLAQLQTPGWANALALSENWVYLSDGFGGLRIYDRSSTPQESFQIPTEDYAGSMAISAGGNLFVTQGESGFLSLALEGFIEPQVYGLTPSDAFVFDVSESAGLLLLCEGMDGFEIFDVSDPSTPQLITQYQPSAGAWSAFLENNVAYVGTGLGGIGVYDLAIPENPTLIGTLQDVGWVEGIRSGGYGSILACSGLDGVYVINTEEMPPVVYDHYDTPGIARRTSTLGMAMALADEMDLSRFGLGLGAPQRDAAAPLTYSLQEPYPNPFNPTANIAFTLAVYSPVELTVFDLMGRKVVSLWTGNLPPGKHRYSWHPDAKISSGTYLISLKAGNRKSVYPLVYLK